jgi:hypothetical protein
MDILGNKKQINQPPRPGNEIVKNGIIYCPGHPSFKSRGKSDVKKVSTSTVGRIWRLIKN